MGWPTSLNTCVLCGLSMITVSVPLTLTRSTVEQSRQRCAQACYTSIAYQSIPWSKAYDHWTNNLILHIIVWLKILPRPLFLGNITLRLILRHKPPLWWQMTPHLMAESEEELKSLMMTVKEESEKCGLKLNIQKTKIMASLHFMSNRWGNNGNSVRLYFLGSKITTDGDCSHEIKRHLLLGIKVMTNLDGILKSRHYFANKKVCLVKALVSPVVNMDVRVGL